MNSLENLAKKIDELDENFKKELKNRTDPSWNQFIEQKDAIVEQITELFPTISDSLPTLQFLLSPSIGYQIVAVAWSRFKKDPSQLNILCYMLLNSSSKFLMHHVLAALIDLKSQCDYEQLCHIKRTLQLYSPPAQSSRDKTKQEQLKIIEPQIEFSISEIVQDSYWWRDVESKLYNSLPGMSQYRICELQVIRNKKLFEQFHAYHSQLGKNDQTVFVYHGSTPQSLRTIAEEGFLESNMFAHSSIKISTPDLGYFGRGIYQGFPADYAIHYSEKYKHSDEILLSIVSSGRSYAVKIGGERFEEDSQSDSDSRSYVIPESKRIVLFQPAQILPLFIIRFKRVSNTPIAEE